MCVIAVDAGNTSIKWLHVAEASLYRCDSIDALVDALLALGCCDQLLVCSVRGVEFDRELASAVSRAIGVLPRFYYAEASFRGVTCAYGLNYSSLGADRWMVILAAAMKFTHRVAVVDLGTAVTIDVVDPEKGHLGGFITPGYESLVATINSKAALINIEPVDAVPVKSLGQSTVDCVNLGCAYMVSALVNDVVSRWQVERVVYTGGGYPLIKKQLKNKGVYTETLVFDGLLLRAGIKI